jgi:hypothetical protein
VPSYVTDQCLRDRKEFRMNVDPVLRRSHRMMLAPPRLVPRRFAYRIALFAAILAAAAATTAWRLWPQAETGSAITSPAWFQAIAAYYHRDQAITRQFDFASLYGRPSAGSHRER